MIYLKLIFKSDIKNENTGAPFSSNFFKQVDHFYFEIIHDFCIFQLQPYFINFQEPRVTITFGVFYVENCLKKTPSA